MIKKIKNKKGNERNKDLKGGSKGRGTCIESPPYATKNNSYLSPKVFGAVTHKFYHWYLLVRASEVIFQMRGAKHYMFAKDMRVFQSFYAILFVHKN